MRRGCCCSAREREREEDVVVDLLIKTEMLPRDKQTAAEQGSRDGEGQPTSFERGRNDVTLLPAAWVCLPGWAEAAAAGEAAV